MRWRWFNNTLVGFFTPVCSATTKSWRDTHVAAHAVGGMVWVLVFRTPVFADWRTDLLLRLLAVGITQATLWEWVQHEMWEAVRILRNLPPGMGYPWLSGIWDTLLAVSGAAVLEGLLFLVRMV